MSLLQQNAIAAHWAAQAALRGVLVAYSRQGWDEAITVTMVPGEVEFESTSNDGAIVATKANAFLALASDLVQGGSPFRPKRHDTITWDGQTYQVRAPGGRQVYGWSDPYQMILRIFTFDEHAEP